LRRTYRSGSHGQESGFAADDRLGIDAFLTPRVRRLACLAGTHDSFARAQRLLAELAGISLADETIRQLCHAEAERFERTRDQRLDTADRFARAAGDWELQIDAGKVNTETGWRDVKAAAFARRVRAEGADPSDHEQRDLPAPSVRSVVAAIEGAEDFAARCRAEADRLKLPGPKELSVLGDGAEWIWNLAGRRFAGAEQVLDVFHAGEYLADLARAGFGAGGAEASRWLDEARAALVGDGWAGVCEFVVKQAERATDRAALEAAFPRVANYLAGHRDRLGYAVRLRRGQAIGSGLIEGTIKQEVGRRMKQTGARWRSEHVGRFVQLRALADGAEWDHYWSAAA
jgi:hypothetical protein